MAKQHTQLWYMKQCRKMLLRIQQLGPDDGLVMIRLKKKAQKYLEKAKEFERGKSSGEAEA